jgi:transcriptional regulator with XRE-family HTH domain
MRDKPERAGRVDDLSRDDQSRIEPVASKRIPNPIDQYVGARIRMRRIMLGMSQERLGDAIGLTFQQVQKYEKGINRIGASRLQQVGHILNVPVEFFFEGAPNQTNGLPDIDGFGEGVTASYVTEFMSTNEGIHLMQAFLRIKDVKIRRRIVDLIEVMSAEQGSVSV